MFELHLRYSLSRAHLYQSRHRRGTSALEFRIASAERGETRGLDLALERCIEFSLAWLSKIVRNRSAVRRHIDHQLSAPIEGLRGMKFQLKRYSKARQRVRYQREAHPVHRTDQKTASSSARCPTLSAVSPLLRPIGHSVRYFDRYPQYSSNCLR